MNKFASNLDKHSILALKNRSVEEKIGQYRSVIIKLDINELTLENKDYLLLLPNYNVLAKAV